MSLNSASEKEGPGPGASLSTMGSSNPTASASAAPSLTHLPDDLLVALLGWVPPLDLLRSVSLVSRQFAAVAVRDGALWRSQYLEAVPSPPVRRSTALSLHQMQRCCVFVTSHHHRDDTSRPRWRREAATGKVIPAVLRPTSVLPSRDRALRMAGEGARACLATTTDRAVEHIENVLLRELGDVDDDDWVAIGNSNGRNTISAATEAMLWNQEGTYWSSAPSESSVDSDEMLLFTTQYRDTLLTDVAIKPFREHRFFDEGMTYSWPAVVVRVYHLPWADMTKNDDDTHRRACSEMKEGENFPFVISKELVAQLADKANSEGSLAAGGKDARSGAKIDSSLEIDADALRPRHQQGVISALLSGHDPVYVSPRREVQYPDSDAWQHFPLPPGVVGNVVTFELLGKNHRQHPTTGFYVCVERVAARGIPLPRHYCAGDVV